MLREIRIEKLQDRLDDGNVDETPEDDKKETQASLSIVGLPDQHALEGVKKLLEDVPTESKEDFDHGSNATAMKSLQDFSENTKVSEGTQSDVTNKDLIENPMKAIQELFKNLLKMKTKTSNKSSIQKVSIFYVKLLISFLGDIETGPGQRQNQTYLMITLVQAL